MQQETIIAGITDIFHDLFADDSIVLSPDTVAADIKGWDSMKHISLIVAIEDRFGIKIKTSEVEGLANVGDLIRTVQTKLA